MRKAPVDNTHRRTWRVPYILRSPGAFCQRLFVSLGRIATTSSLLLESRGGYSERFLAMILAAHDRRRGQRTRRACPRVNCCKRSVRSMRSKPSLPFESHRYLTSKCFFNRAGSLGHVRTGFGGARGYLNMSRGLAGRVVWAKLVPPGSLSGNSLALVCLPLRRKWRAFPILIN